MCCFSTKTEVHSTSIFGRMTGSGTQALVYQMQYAAAEPTAMILPLPVALPAADATVRWKSLKEYASFFADLESGFPEEQPKSQKASRSVPAAVAAAPLPVHEVGDFVASFVPSVSDFSRIDPRFVIAKDIWAAIPEYADYGFAVFQLKSLAGTPHPIAFEFDTRMPDAVYFPTVHIHDGTVHREDDFDHALYLQEARFDARVSGYDGPDAVDRSTGHVRSKEKVASFASVERAGGLLDGSLLVHRATMKGMLPNRDTIVSLGSTAAPSTGCGRCDMAASAAPSPFGPGGLALLGLSWVIRRRNDRRRA
jgi:MYXO-CTERM domain-containing protein